MLFWGGASCAWGMQGDATSIQTKEGGDAELSAAYNTVRDLWPAAGRPSWRRGSSGFAFAPSLWFPHVTVVVCAETFLGFSKGVPWEAGFDYVSSL